MEAILEICCGLDVHRDNIVACLMKGNLDNKPTSEIRTFPALQHGLKELKEWIASLLRSGLLSGSFIPDKEIRELRDLTRYRKTMVQGVSTQKNRIERFLQSCGLKLSTFMSDVFGVSGRLVLNHLIQLEENVEELNIKIDEYLEKFSEAEQILDGIPGISKVAAAAIIGEIGIDMSKFANVENICSWAGVSPGCNESAGKSRSTRTRHGNPYIKSILCEVAWTVTRRKGTYLSNWYWRVNYDEYSFEAMQINHEKNREKKLIQELQKRGYKIEPIVA